MPRTVDLEYDENVGNPATAACLLSFEREQDFVVATADALPWSEPANGDADRITVPIVWIESLLRKAKVEDPNSLRGVPFFTSCLSCEAITDGSLNALLEAGLVDVPAVDGEEENEEEVRDFLNFTELQKEADAIAQSKRDDDDRLSIDASRWDRFEALGANSEYQWLEDITIGELTGRCNSLEVYVDLSKTLGPRGLEAIRSRAGEQVKIMAGGGQGGQLLALLKEYYLAPAAAALPVAPAFMAYRLPDFLIDTRWPEPLDVELKDMRDYAFDMTLRATWQKAGRNEWPTIVQGRLGPAIRTMDLLHDLCHDLTEQPGALAREIQRLGDCVLPGEAAQKNAFCRLKEIERRVGEEYEGLIREGRANNTPAVTTVDKIIELATASGSNEKAGTSTVDGGADDPVAAPKRAHISRALAERSYVQLRDKYAPLLRDTETKVDKMELLAECLAAETVLPKAVLLACPGTRVADYLVDADFLGQLVDERAKMRMYLGQCMAYNDEDEQVPEELRTFEFDAEQYEQLRSFKWEKLDPLNHAVLKLKAEEAGTRYATHNPRQLYHHSDMIEQVAKVYGKLFKAIGYPEKVSGEEGLTFEQFLAKLKRLQEHTMGMADDEAQGIFALVDEYARAGYEAAAAHAKTTIYGANPANKRLRAWVPAGEPVLVKLNDTLKAVREVQKFRRHLPNVFGSKPTARTLPGFEKRGGGTSSRDEGDTPRYAKRQKTTEGTPRGTDRKATEEERAEMRKILSNKASRIKENPKRVFYYADGTYSMKHFHVDWPGICKRFGWKENELCGPVVMTFSKERNRDHNCMDSSHK